MKPETLSLVRSVWEVLQPLLAALATVAAALLLRRYNISSAMTTTEQTRLVLGEAMRDAVATVYQRTVKDLKDPTREGEFDEDARKRAARAALDLVRRSHPRAIETLTNLGFEPEAILEQMLERAVVELNAMVSPSVSLDVVKEAGLSDAEPVESDDADKGN